MKIILLALLLLCAPPVMAAGNITVSIPDIMCEVCAQTITATLEKEPAVQSVVVDVEARTAEITLKPKATLDDATIRQSIDKAGFKADAIDR